MTVSSTLNKVIYPGNGSTTSFPFTFSVPNGTVSQIAAQLQVIYTDSFGNQTTLTQGSSSAQYQLSVNPLTGTNPTPAGGTVTYNPSGGPIALGTSLTILRVLPIDQLTSLANQGTLYQPVEEAALDYLAMLSQQIQEVQGRAFSVSPSDPAPAPVVPVAARAGQGAIWDINGNLAAGVLPSSGVISSAMAPVVSASTLALARSTMLVGSLAYFLNVAAVQAATIASDVNIIRTAAFSSVNGVGSSFYVRQASMPADLRRIQSADGAWWVAIQSNIIDVTTLGADPSGSADCTTALNNAFSCLSGTGGTIYFPPGRYKFLSSITYNFPGGTFNVVLQGNGDDNTTLTWPGSGGGITLNYNNIFSSAHIKDLTFTTGTAAGGQGLTLNLSTAVSNPAVTASSFLSDVTFRGDDGYAATDYWTNCINIQNVSNVQFYNVTTFGSASALGVGVLLTGLPSSATYGVVYNFTTCYFQNLAVGINYGSYIQGVTINQCNFTATTTGINVPASATGTLAELAITNSQFNPAVASGICIAMATAVDSITISNNIFILVANSQICMDLAQTQRFCISANSIGAVGALTGVAGIIIGPPIAPSEGSITGNDIFGGILNGIILQTNAPATNIVGNSFNTQSGGACIVIQSSVSSYNIVGNSFFGPAVTATINNSSGTAAANGRITDNLNWNPVGVSSITVGGSPFTYSAGPQPETVYISGGTVSSIAVDRNSGGVFPLGVGFTSGTVELGPNEAVRVTYTGTPTMITMRH